MSKETLLPQRVDAIRFADTAIELQGMMPIHALERLVTTLSGQGGEVHADIHFGKDEQGIRFMRCDYETKVQLQCQRCMEPFEQDMSGQLVLGIVKSEEEANLLPKTYEPVFVKEDGTLSLHEAIEDELILGIPIVPMHKTKECKVKLPHATESNTAAETEKENPFKVIEFLRSKRNSNK